MVKLPDFGVRISDMSALRRLILYLILFVPVMAAGQAEEFYFRHLTTQEGLSNNTVYAINQDSLGFIWIGTRSGLNRYDGYGFRVYDLSSGLRNVFINTLFRDSRGRLWVGTQGGGLSLYEYETGRFSSYIHDPSDSATISHDDVQAIAEDGDGFLWIGTHDGGLDRFDPLTRRVWRIHPGRSLPPGYRIDRINALLMEQDTLLWIGTLDGLFSCNTRTGRIVPYIMNGKPLAIRVLCLFIDNGHRLWLGTQNGIVRLDRKNGHAEFINSSRSTLSNDLVVDIRQHPDGRILIATDGGGLNIYDPSTGTISAVMNNPNSPNSLSNNSVYAIYIDSYRGLWIGNYIGGLNYFSVYDWKFKPVKHEMNDPNSLSNNHVRCFYQDRAGKLWIGTLGGLNEYDPGSGTFRVFKSERMNDRTLGSNTVLSLYEDREGDLWVGTFGGGISMLDRNRSVFRKFSHPDDTTGSLNKANIYCILEASGNVLCMASLGGIYLLDRNTGRLRRYLTSNSGLTNNTVKVLCRDARGIIWAGTNQGLNRLNCETGEITAYQHTPDDIHSLSNNRILTIIESREGTLWIGTEGGGVSVFDPERATFSRLTVQDGLPDNVVNSILQDDAGFFWLATNKGLVRYDQGSGKMRVYTGSDGLQSNEFNQNAAMRSREGDLFFGGINGYNVIQPGRLIRDDIPPKVILTDLHLSNKIVLPGEEHSPLEKQLFLQEKIVLGYNSAFEIDFATPGFINSGKYKYSYRMKGLNEEWTDFREHHSAIYPNLPPGRYTFMVRATNSDGVISTAPASVEVRILPPPWKTWWAFSIYALIILGLLSLFMRYNMSWVKVKNQLILERREKEQIEELNQMKLGFFTNISHEFKTPLTLILGNIDNMRGNEAFRQSDQLRSIEKNARRLLILINQLLEFRKAENGLMKLKASKGNIIQFLSEIRENFTETARIRNIRFELVVNGSIPDIWFDAEKLEKVMFNLLSNAFRHVQGGDSVRIVVGVREPEMLKGRVIRPGYAEITVHDTGTGIPAAEMKNLFDRFYQESKDGLKSGHTEGSGIGLAYSRKLVELHHGEISAESEPGSGTAFTFLLPVGKDHLLDEEIKQEVNFHLKLDYKGIIGVTQEESPLPAPLPPVSENQPILLVVDDNPMICNVIMEKFRVEYQVLTAGNGTEGLELARKYVPDIIISDILMPGMDGIEFCRQIKQELLTCHIPVIMLTAKSDEESQIEGLQTGADAYIGKPYNPGILKATLDNLIQSRKVLLNKFYGKSHFTPSEVVTNKMDEKFLNRLIQMIEASSEDENIDIQQLCREIAMSRSALYRKLKALTGTSIQDFVRMVRLRKASRLLLETNLTISEIAFRAGFPNTKHFSTSFRKQFGKTPTEFRHNN